VLSGDLAAFNLTSLLPLHYLLIWSNSKFDHTTPELRDNILQFYSGAPASVQTSADKAGLTPVLALLDQLRAATPAPVTEVAR
jgi:hypothetical protein